jgi:hypothetical protein
MNAKTSVWVQRFETLKTSGVTFEQALVVYRIIDDARGFRTQTLATYAMAALRRVYGKDT